MKPGDKSELEVAFQSFKISAKGPEAIQAIRWPLAVVLLAVAAVLIIVAWRSHPIDALAALVGYFRR